MARLPDLKVPDFNGKLDEWVRFRDLFEALIVSKETLTGVEKLEYLQTCLKGDALSIIKHLTPSNENFNVAWNLVKDCFNKPQFIMVAHLDNIFDQPPLKSGSLSEIKRLFTVTSENINALRALSLPVDQWDVLMVYFLSKKLDSGNRMLWIRFIKNKSDSTLCDFNRFLGERINELESLNLSNVGHSSSYKSSLKDTGKRVMSASIPFCPKCKHKHFLYMCQQFRDLDVPARFEFVKSNNICPNCIRAKHNINEYKFSQCKTCGLKHNTMLHYAPHSSSNNISQNSSSGISRSQQQSSDSSNGLVVNTMQHSYRECFTMLPTAMVMVRDERDELQMCRALLDSGSQATLISESCLQRLGLKRSHAKIPILGLGQDKSVHGTRGKVHLEVSSHVNAFSLSVQAFVLSSLTNDLPSVEIPRVNLSYFNNLTLSYPTFSSPQKIDIILGADIFFDIIAEGRITHPSGSPVAQNTIFGWVLAGRVSLSNEHEHYLRAFHSTVDTDAILRKFFENENVVNDNFSQNEVSESIENHFASTHFINVDGRFVVSLPFSKTSIEFGNSRDAAIKRLMAMEKRFSKDLNLKREYAAFMEEYAELDHMSVVPEGERERPSFYLPHHAILKPTSTTTKLRVVFDASCKSSSDQRFKTI